MFGGLCEPVELYKDYKNRTFDKFLNRALNLLNNIEQTSLKPSDRELLLKKVKEQIKKF